MAKTFTEKQKEILARRLGYDGPMNMFEQFVQSDPAMERKYSTVIGKLMARKGTYVTKMQVGGTPSKSSAGQQQIPSWLTPPDPMAAVTMAQQTYTNPATGETFTAPTGGYTVNVQPPSQASPPPKFGESVTSGPIPSWLTPPPPMTPVTQALTTYTNPVTGETFTTRTGGYTVNVQQPSGGPSAPAPTRPVTTAPAPQTATGSVTIPQPATSTTASQPVKPTTPLITAAQIQQEPGQIVTTAGAPTTASKVTSISQPAATTVAPEAAKPTATMTAAAAAPTVATTLKDVEAAQGTVSPGAQVTAAQVNPMDTAVAKVEAAQGTTRQVEGAPVRTLEAGEVIEGSAVDREAVDKAIEETKASAAQGEVTEDMTVQGQLSRLVTDFEAGNPPSWAAASLRNVTTQLAQRGLSVSSLAGQALIQATLEAAVPIAAQDAQVYRDMGIQNLNNRQQTAVLAAQQRAQFLGQEFDQAFQSRVINAATVSSIANVNFEAKQQIALENARLAQTMDLANLNNRQAMVLATASQIATLETANLNNRQQAAVVNAQSFLQMDISNLNNRQQTTLFKSQEMINSLLSDTAAENASRQFNASSINQVNQFYDSLATQVKTFNATQANAMSQFNTEQANAVTQFNASVQNQRDQFNAESRRIIDQSNAEWRRNISTANTAATNRANEINANSALQLTSAEYNNLWQKHRDDIEFAWKTGENVLDRENQLAMQVLQKQATIEAAEFQVEAAKYQALGALGATVLQDSSVMKAIGGTISDVFNVIRGLTGAGGKETLEYTGTFISAITGKETTWDPIMSPTGGGMWDNGWQYFSDPEGNNVTISDTGDYFYNGSIVWSPDQGRYID